jgi:hypothetical protein
MNLIEVLVATALFLGSSGASLAIWSRAAGSLAADQQRLLQFDRLEAELAAGEARLRDPLLRQGVPGISCAMVRDRLVQAIERVPVPAGMERQLSLPPGGDLLELRLRSGGEERLRLYSPAAFGGCGGETPLDPEAGHGT